VIYLSKIEQSTALYNLYKKTSLISLNVTVAIYTGFWDKTAW